MNAEAATEVSGVKTIVNVIGAHAAIRGHDRQAVKKAE